MSKVRILVVEDDENRCKWFREKAAGMQIDITCNIAEAKKLLTENNYTQIFLDHDLKFEHYGSNVRDDENTGYAIAEFLAMRRGLSENAEIIVHSLNPGGSDRMWRKLRETRRYVRKTPFHQLQRLI